MRVSYKGWTGVAVLTAVLFVAFLILGGCRRATTSAVAMTFIGYTNPPGNPLRFALFSVSNQAPYAVRWRGSWVEIEGNPNHKAEMVNASLPGFTRKPALNAGDSLTMAIGEALSDADGGRWRYAMSYVPYNWRQRWLDFSMRHNLPGGLQSVWFIDTQSVLDPSNNVTVTTIWLTK